MKPTVRIIALLMSIVMLVFLFASCSNNNDFEVFADETDKIDNEVTGNLPSTDNTNGDGEDNFIFEIVYPSVYVSSMKFDLTDKDLEEYKDKVLLTKQMFAKNDEVSEDEFRNALYELLSLEAEIETQRDIAYIQYKYDMSNSSAWNNYLYAYNLHDEAHDLFWGFYSEAKNKNNNLSIVFKDVVQKEYKGNLVSVTPAADYYAYEMEVLEGEYNSLKNNGASDEEIFEVYKKYMIAAEGYAISSNTDNYYEYASKYNFHRNDTSSQRELIRKYVKEYIVPLCKELGAKHKSYDNKLSGKQYSLSNKYLYGKYDSFDKDYLFSYFSSLPKTSGKAMKDAFKNDRVLIGDRVNSYDGAMVSKIGNTPICYFHEDSTTLDTMSHELGHYYASVVGDSTYYSFDLKETHSTANSMLLFSYLSDKLDSKAFTSAELYMVYNWTYQTILSVIKDEFDEIIYTLDPSTIKLEDFERIMNELIDEYNIRGLTGSIENQLLTYWRRLGIVYPMSNYSYATAFIASFQIYVKSKDNYVAATEIYRKIVEETDYSGNFLLTIEKAGLTSPYNEQTYKELKKLTKLF